MIDGVEALRAVPDLASRLSGLFGAISQRICLYFGRSQLSIGWLPAGQGCELEDTLRYVPILTSEGVDLFDVSSGGTDRHQQVQLGQQYQVPFAKAVKDLKLPNVFVGAVGWILDGETVHDVSCTASPSSVK